MRLSPSSHPVQYARRAAGAALLAALLLWLGAPAHARRVAAQTSGALHTLTLMDSGSTLTVPLGDSIELRLTTALDWNVQVSDTTVLRRPPVALVRSVQGLWLANQPGRATISATGSPPCINTRPACTLPSIDFAATVVVAGAPPPQPGVSATYRLGWNIIGAPSGAVLPVDAFAWDPVAGRYMVIAAGSPLKGGTGYWAFFYATQAVALPPAGVTVARVSAPAGAWVLVGNPSDVSSATVSGADALFTYDPTAGVYAAAPALPPGAGAWARSNAGGEIVISAQPPAPPMAFAPMP